MSAFFDLIRYGGWPSYLVMFSALLGLGGGLGSLLAARRLGSRAAAMGAATIALCLALLPLAAGVAGWQLGLQQTEQAVRYADPESAAAMRAQGHEEAFSCVILGGICAAVPLLLALAGLGQAAMAPMSREG